MTPDQSVAIVELLILFGTFVLASVNAVFVRTTSHAQVHKSEIWLEILTAAIYAPIATMRALGVDLASVNMSWFAYSSIWIVWVTFNASVVKHVGLLLVVVNPMQWSQFCPLLDPACVFTTAAISAVQCFVFWGSYGLHHSGLYAAFTLSDSDPAILFPYLAFVILYATVHAVCTVMLTCRVKTASRGKEGQTVAQIMPDTLRVLRQHFFRFWLNRVASWLLICILPLVSMLTIKIPWSYHVASVLLCKAGMLARMAELCGILVKKRQHS